MAITKSYNKKTNIHYAYETSYVWDEEKGKNVQRKRCIGHFDPITGELVPNGKVGRPSASVTEKHEGRKALASISDSLSRIRCVLKVLYEEIETLEGRVDDALKKMEKAESPDEAMDDSPVPADAASAPEQEGNSSNPSEALADNS